MVVEVAVPAAARAVIGDRPGQPVPLQGADRVVGVQDQPGQPLSPQGVVGALGTTPQQGNQDRHAEATWRERALNAETGLKDAFAEIGRQRGTIAELMGKIRDMESAYPDDSVHRITTENATFRRRVLQLEDANRALDERLKASRENARFMDRRLAELEVQLVENIDASPS